jgi:hypothetical protein
MFHPKTFPNPANKLDAWIEAIQTNSRVKKSPHYAEYFTHLKILTTLNWAKEILHNYSDQYNDQLRNVPELSLINIEKLQANFKEDLCQGKTVSDYCSLIQFDHLSHIHVLFHFINRRKLPIPSMA